MSDHPEYTLGSGNVFADLDYQDNHFYIDHYNFPHTAWDSRDWRIRDTSAVGTGMSSILNMAASRGISVKAEASR